MYLMDQAGSTRENRRRAEGRPSEHIGEKTKQYSNTFFDISIETQLLAEIKDIRDELQIINMVLQYQSNVLPEVAENILRELGGKKSPEATEIERKKKEQLKLIEIHMKDIKRMMEQTDGIYASLTNLLDLKQKHANAFEARFASNQAALTARQGQTILVFTIVTIVFLPMSFIASFFAINMEDFSQMNDGKGLRLGYVAKYMFGIGLSVSLPLIIIALAFDDVGIWMRGARKWFTRLLSGSSSEPPPGKDGRQMSDLEHKVQAILDVPRSSNARKSMDGVRHSVDGMANGIDRKHLAWDESREVGDVRPRARRESRASRGSGWSHQRPRVSFDRRRRVDEEDGDVDLERGREKGEPFLR